MDAKEATHHLATIRKIMESATQLTVMPAKAALAGGILTLMGCGITRLELGTLNFDAMNHAHVSVRLFLIVVWAAVAILATGTDMVLAVLTARRCGQNPWYRFGKMAIYAMGPAVAVAGILTVVLALQKQWQLVPGVWMLLYGTALWTASVMSVRASKLLAFAFFLGGVLALFWLPDRALLLVGLTFGLGHIVFGIYLLATSRDGAVSRAVSFE